MIQRRELNFQSFDEAMREAESLAQQPVQTSGSYSFGQIIEHLARTLDVVTGTTAGPKLSLPLRWAARIMRSRLLNRPMQPGFRLPEQAQSIFWPSEDVQLDAAMEHLRSAAERFRSTDPLPPHPIFGKMTREQHQQLQCRHFELHLSFASPA